MKMSFEASRKEMLAEVKKQSSKTESKVIRFEDNGVPEFLEKLDAFEKASRKATFVVG